MTTPVDVLAPDDTLPACPTCHSQGRRCVEPDGSLAWPWHVQRTVLFDADYLASDRVALGFTDTLGTAIGYVAAYLAGVEDARRGAPVIDPDGVRPQLAAAVEILREQLAAKS